MLYGIWFALGLACVIFSRFAYIWSDNGTMDNLIWVAVGFDIVGLAFMMVPVALNYGIFDYLKTIT